MAFEMAAVSPFRNDSNTRKSFTDCSIEAGLCIGDAGDGTTVGEGTPLSCKAKAAFDMVADRCGRCLEGCLWCWTEGVDEMSEVADGEAGVGLLLSAMSLASCFEPTRPRRCLTLLDLVLLCPSMVMIGV
jgi:hypothetical protein